MINTSTRFYLIVFCFLSIFLLQSASADEIKKKVLVLHAYHQGYHWTDRIMAGMESVFDQRNDIELFVSYMDTKRCSDPAYFKQLRDLYATKYELVTFDAIVSSDDHALDFLLEFRDELFPNTPVIFSGINIFEKERLKGKSKFTGIYESYDIQGTIDLMLSLHPETTNITIVSDDTLSGRNFKQLVVDAQSSFSNSVNFNYLYNLSPKDLQQSLKKLPENSLVLWAIYLRTPFGTTLSSEESVKLVSHSSRFPTYCIWDVVGQGVIGGKITSPDYQGQVAAETALRILQGTNIEDIPVVGSPLVNIFDYNVMKKFNLTPSQIPEPKLFLNKPKTFYEKYKRSIWVVSAIVILVMTTVTFLVSSLLLKRQRDQFEHLAMRDQLTGLYNRHYLEEIASHKLSEAIQHQQSLCLLVLDIDLFKTINDTYGHPFGDEVLQRFATLLNKQSRLEDIVARIGGEEFVIIIDHCTIDEAYKKAELIRLSTTVLKPNEVALSVSIGVSELNLNGETFSELLARADKAVYQAKNNGRNCVISL